PPHPPLFPYTTLFRSRRARAPITGTEAVSARRAWRMPSPAALPSLRERREVCRGRASLQRAVPLHRQFGPLHHGGGDLEQAGRGDRKSTRLNSSHVKI